MRCQPEQQALEHVVREVQNEQTEAPDWDAIETALMRRVDRVSSSSVSRGSGVPRAWLFAMGAVAIAVLCVSIGRAWRSHAPEPAAASAIARVFGPNSSGTIDGSELRPGDRVVSDVLPISVQHASQVRWTLAPHSRATVRERGSVVAIALDSGSLSAEVVRVHRPESFVVEAAGVRVAVHGTRFQVDRLANRVLVSVSEGLVKVGAVSAQPGQRSWLVAAQQHGQFSIDAARGEVFVPRVPLELDAAGKAKSSAGARLAERARNRAAQSSLERAPQEASSSTGADPSGPLPAARVELPAKPSIGDVEASLSGVIDTLNRCFLDHRPGRGDMHVTAQVVLRLEIAPDGHIAEEAFEPPLAPAVSECARTSADQVRFTESRDGVRVTRTLELGR